jgi:hypothetical protein
MVPPRSLGMHAGSGRGGRAIRRGLGRDDLPAAPSVRCARRVAGVAHARWSRTTLCTPRIVPSPPLATARTPSVRKLLIAPPIHRRSPLHRAALAARAGIPRAQAPGCSLQHLYPCWAWAATRATGTRHRKVSRPPGSSPSTSSRAFNEKLSVSAGTTAFQAAVAKRANSRLLQAAGGTSGTRAASRPLQLLPTATEKTAPMMAGAQWGARRSLEACLALPDGFRPTCLPWCPPSPPLSIDSATERALAAQARLRDYGQEDDERTSRKALPSALAAFGQVGVCVEGGGVDEQVGRRSAAGQRRSRIGPNQAAPAPHPRRSGALRPSWTPRPRGRWRVQQRTRCRRAAPRQQQRSSRTPSCPST